MWMSCDIPVALTVMFGGKIAVPMWKCYSASRGKIVLKALEAINSPLEAK